MIIVTLTQPEKTVRFTWADNGEDCDFITIGDVTDEELEAMVEAKAHEGVDFPGWQCDIE